MYSNGCRFIVFDGFRVTGADRSSSANPAGQQRTNVDIMNCDDVKVRWFLLSTNNRYFNDYLFAFEFCLRPIIEDSEAYDYHRHAYSMWKDSKGRASRVYCNSRGRADITGGYVSNSMAGGDECVSIYGTEGFKVENMVSEDGRGVQMHAGADFTGAAGGSNTLVVGGIGRDEELSFYMDSRVGTASPPIVSDNTFIQQHRRERQRRVVPVLLPRAVQHDALQRHVAGDWQRAARRRDRLKRR
jgi:hypothetical protein